MGMMPIDYVIDEKKCKETIEKLNDAAMRLGKNGFKFFFHHHHYEFFKHNGQTVFDYMIENAPYINFTLDTYWLQYAGVDVCDFIEKVKGRIDCVHLKDYMITCKQEENKPTELVPLFCPIGDGLMNFKKIARKLEECGAKFYFVEQDNAALLPDTLEQVSRSADYIIKNL
jgi:sugar phosphate isomerase/epimerase